MDLSDYKVVSVGLAVAVPVLFWLVKRSRRSSKDTTSVPEIPLACADEMHWFLGHAPLMQDMLAGEKPPRRSPPSHVLAVNPSLLRANVLPLPLSLTRAPQA